MRWASLCLGVFCFLWSLPGWGQSSPVRPSAQQLRLMDRGAKAYQRQDFKKAARFYRQALDLGALNVAYLNLGRLLQKQGLCQEANASYALALSAPAVQTPSLEQIGAKVTRYREELAQTCPGVIVVRCVQEDLSLRLQGRPIPCDFSVERPPGRYRLEIRKGAVARTQEVLVRAAQTVEVQAILPASSSPSLPPPPKDGGVWSGSRRQWLGWSLLAAGGAAVVTGGVFTNLVLKNNGDVEALAQSPLVDPLAAQELFDRGGSYNSAQLLSYSLGVVLSATGGLVLFFWEDPAQESASALQFGVSPGPENSWSLWLSLPLE